jgi:hypothetical protein
MQNKCNHDDMFLVSTDFFHVFSPVLIQEEAAGINLSFLFHCHFILYTIYKIRKCSVASLA